MTNIYTPRRSAEQWQILIEQWQQSGQSAKQFCSEQRLGYASFCQWRKRLTSSSGPTDDQRESAFIDLSSIEQASPKGWHIVLSLGGGVELTLSQG